jgi:hypothetical protein
MAISVLRHPAAVTGVTLMVLLVVSCGGGDRKPSLTEEEQRKLAKAYSTATQYCIAQIRRKSLGRGTGGELGKVAEAVDTAIQEYKDHEPDATVQFTPSGSKQTLRQYMRHLQTVLGKGSCATDQAQKVDQALAGA